ncbi:hypothetical protein V5O48_011972, partial [Marasmius crinis-equi]
QLILPKGIRSSDFRALWENRRRILKLPQPLPHIKVADWLLLMLGPSTCRGRGCTSESAGDVIFALNTRLCTNCAETSLISEETLLNGQRNPFAFGTGEEAKEFAKLVQSMTIDRKIYYSRHDIELVRTKLADCEEGERPAFVQKRQSAIEEKLRVDCKCESLLSVCKAELREEAIAERVDAVKTEISKLGFTEEDCGHIKSVRGVYKPVPLTPEGWKAIKPSVVNALVKRRLLNVFSVERSPEVGRRYKMYAQVCKRIKEPFRPIECREFPSPWAMIKGPLTPLSRLIAAPDSLCVTQVDFDSYEEEIRSRMEREAIQARENFLSRSKDHPVIEAERHRTLSLGQDPLPLLECLYSAGKPDSYVAVSAFLAIGIEPLLTTPDEMDAQRDVFRCMICYRLKLSRPMFWGSWREWLSHVHIAHKDGLDMGRRSLFMIQPGHKDRKSYGWSCNHCYDFDLDSFSEVEVHVRTVHGILNPQIPEDLFINDPTAHLDRVRSAHEWWARVDRDG